MIVWILIVLLGALTWGLVLALLILNGNLIVRWEMGGDKKPIVDGHGDVRNEGETSGK